MTETSDPSADIYFAPKRNSCAADAVSSNTYRPIDATKGAYINFFKSNDIYMQLNNIDPYYYFALRNRSTTGHNSAKLSVKTLRKC